MRVEKGLEQTPLGLISAAAHDIKTPLVFIRGAANQLGQNPTDTPEVVKQLRRIEQSAGRLLNLVDSLIGSAQAKQQELVLEPLHAERVIGQTLEDIEPYAHELGFEINLKLSRKLPPILSHRLALKRVLFNLLDNAVKYSGDRKQIDIKARRDQGHVRITIRDYGIGIRQEDVKTIWKLFGRAVEPTTAIPGSSGLGLYIAASLSQSLSAKLDLKSYSMGTSFFLRLPVANQLSLF